MRTKLNRWLTQGWSIASRYYLYVLTPVAACLLLAIGYLALVSQTWQANQSLLVRDDLLGDNFKPGRFTSLETQKNAQEMILHIARKPMVIRAALAALGPEKKLARQSEEWITEDLLDEIKNQIAIIAPNGAEFGKTDVVVLTARAKGRERARAFVELLTDEIEVQLRQVRESQLQSMQDELRLSIQQISRQYDLVADKVRQIEQQAGPDLAALRSLVDRSSGNNDVQRSLEQIRQERRAAESELDVATKQLETLEAVEANPDQLVMTSNELLSMQPIIKRLHEGLTDAELRLMANLGRYEPSHPLVEHDREVIEQTKDQIRREVTTFIESLKSQQSLAQQKLDRLKAAEQECVERLTQIGKQRVEYEIMIRELEKRGESLGKAKTDLAAIQSLAESVRQVSLITRVGDPQADLRPLGMSKRATLFLALLGGLIVGGGLIVLNYDPKPLDSIAAASEQEAKNQRLWATLSRFHQFVARSTGSPPNQSIISDQTPAPEPAPAVNDRPYGAGGTSPLIRPAELLKQMELANRPEESAADVAPNPTIETFPIVDELISSEFNSTTPSSGEGDSPPKTSDGREFSTVEIVSPKVEHKVDHETAIPKRARSLTLVLDQVDPVTEKQLAQAPIEIAPATLDTASATQTPSARRNVREAKNTVDLDELRRTLAEAAAQSRPGLEDSEQLRSKLEAIKPDESRRRSVTQRITELSESISAYCEPVRKKPNNGVDEQKQ